MRSIMSYSWGQFKYMQRKSHGNFSKIAIYLKWCKVLRIHAKGNYETEEELL